MYYDVVGRVLAMQQGVICKPSSDFEDFQTAAAMVALLYCLFSSSVVLPPVHAQYALCCTDDWLCGCLQREAVVESPY